MNVAFHTLTDADRCWLLGSLPGPATDLGYRDPNADHLTRANESVLIPRAVVSTELVQDRTLSTPTEVGPIRVVGDLEPAS